MATARDIIAGAYQRLGLLPPGADLDPARADAGLTLYNDMLNAWAADGIFPGGPNPPVQFADGIGGGVVDGSVGTPGGYPPFGPADAATPPSPAPLALGLNDAFPLLAQFVEGAKAILAVELASASGIEAQPSTQRRAEQARKALLAYYVIAPRAGQDPALTVMPSQRHYGLR